MTKPMNGTTASPPDRPAAFRVLHRKGQTKVLDARDRPVDGVIACDISLRPGVPPLMRMNLVASNFEVGGLVVFQIYDPSTLKFRPVKRVEFADGGPDFVPEVAQPSPPVSATAPAATDHPSQANPSQEPY